MLLGILLAIAFVTLFERHVLGIRQNRVGPNKVRFGGVLQAVLDGVKLLTKEHVVPHGRKLILFLIAPLVSFIIMILEWFTLPLHFKVLSFQWRVLFFICCIGLIVYAILISGIVSYSKYGAIGAVRACSQTISYEVVFALLLLSLIVLFVSYSFTSSINFLILAGLFVPWFICLIAETNRAPFDFAEGERELVRGFNVEYGRGRFVLLFLAEYGSILILRYLTSVLFFSLSLTTGFIFFMVILIRSVYPRFRYDKLMGLVWFKLLPLVLYFLLFVLFVFYCLPALFSFW